MREREGERNLGFDRMKDEREVETYGFRYQGLILSARSLRFRETQKLRFDFGCSITTIWDGRVLFQDLGREKMKRGRGNKINEGEGGEDMLKYRFEEGKEAAF